MPPEQDPNEKEELLFDVEELDLCTEPSDISFYVGENNIEALKICANGDFLVHGKKVKNDIDVYNGFVNFLKEAGHYDQT